MSTVFVCRSGQELTLLLFHMKGREHFPVQPKLPDRLPTDYMLLEFSRALAFTSTIHVVLAGKLLGFLALQVRDVV